MTITTYYLFVILLFVSLASADELPAPKCYTPVPTTKAPTKCEEKCGLNEVYSECGNNGCQNTCENPRIAMVCRGICTPGCICADGYLRNSQGVCVLPKDCDCKNPNEIFSECDNIPCQNTCKEPDLITRCTYEAGCYPGCICKPGFLRDENGVCVPQSQCYQCKENEIFKDCGSFGCENTCDNPRLNEVCDPSPNCEPGCFCLPGFVRNSTGYCILEQDCRVHEVYSECGNNSCQRNCDTYDLTLACKPSCFPSCICEDGHIRNKNGVCVKPEECENRQCTGKNEEYSTCVSPCGETCATMNKDIVCNFLVCNPGCDCKKGFYRNSKNECVPPEECDCPENEELDKCFNPCPPRTCSAIGKLFKCAVPPTCKFACDCKFNYRRNEDGLCIPVKDCSPLKCTGPNEVYDPCPKECLDESCQSLYTVSLCLPVTRECQPRCVCAEGYLRNDQGECIPKEKCKEYCADPNAIFNPCGNTCPITCANKDKPRICPDVCLASGGCVCKEGFVQNYEGICIKPEQCPQCGENEFFSCGSACDTTCATLGEPCPIVNIKCVERCYCVDGYARDEKDVCIPIKACPPKFNCTGQNQVYNACPIQCPPEETCEFYLSGMAYGCSAPETRVCIPRCECRSGFIRKVANGDCIKPNQCCDDPNAEVVSCPNPCPGGTCESPKFADCKAPCKIRGCQCKPGYVKDSAGKCILLSHCPKKTCTGQNEEYRECCPLVQETCATMGIHVCKECKPGCCCKDGFVRDCHGKCIKKCDCPKLYPQHSPK